MKGDYSKGKIYKMIAGDEIYVGATCSTLAKRKGEHKSRSKRKPNRRVYKKCLEVGWDNVDIVLVTYFSCNNKVELHREERRVIELLGASLNMAIPTRTKRERESLPKYLKWRREYKLRPKQKQHTKEYLEKNKKRISDKGKIKITCECGSIFTRINKSHHLKTKKHKKFAENKL